MTLQYTVCGDELPYPVKFPYPGYLQVFMHNLILGIQYPGKFSYPVKVSKHKSAYFFERNKN